MRIPAMLGFMLTLVACNAQEDRQVAAPDRARAGGQNRSLAGGNPGAPGLTNRPLDGSGTPSVLPMWTTPTTLGDSPLKVAPNGDILMKPGRAIWVLSEDGSKCWRFSGQNLAKFLPPDCPTY